MTAVRRIRAELVHDCRAELAEGPRWDPRAERLLFVDILGSSFHLLDPETGWDEVMPMGRHVGAVLPRRTGGYAVAIREGFIGLADDGAEEIFCVLFEDEARRMNDARCDRAGRMWGTSMTYDLSPGGAALYRLGIDRVATEVIGNLWLGNGIDWSPDDRRMYLVDTYSHGVDQLDFDVETGQVSNRRRLADIPRSLGNPDGLTVDLDGCIWVAVYGSGEVHRYTPSGQLDTVVEIPGVMRVTSPGFGGAEMDCLYVTTGWEHLEHEERRRQPHAGGIFACHTGARGQETSMYGG